MAKKFRTAIRWLRFDNPKSKIKNPKWAGIVAIVVTLAMCGAVALAQQPKKVPRVGYLSGLDSARESTRSEGFRLALRERGYIEGQNIAIEYRYTEGKNERAPELAAELVRLMDSSFLTMTLSIGRMGQG